MPSGTEKTGRTLLLAFLGAILVPCGLLVFFGLRAMEMEAQMARSRRETRLKNTAEVLSRQVDGALARLRDRAEDAFWPLREPVFERETAEQALAALVASDSRILCGVLFDGQGRVLGPELSLPFRGFPESKLKPAPIFDLRPGETIETAEDRLRRTLALRQMLNEALFQEGLKFDPSAALQKIRVIEERSEDENLRALAVYHGARIKLSLGGALDAASAAEAFIKSGVNGPIDEGSPVRGKVFQLWSEAWLALGSPGRSLEILFWFWEELLGGRYEVEEAGFTALEEDLAARALRVLESMSGDSLPWRERIDRFRRQGRAALEAYRERRLLETEVLPRAAAEGFGEGPGFFRALLEDRLELFLYLPPARFEAGLAEGAAVGAGFRVDAARIFRDTVSPLVDAFEASEVRVLVIDQSGKAFGGESVPPDAVEAPLAEPLASWRVAVAPGTSDPEGRRAREQAVFGAALIATAVLAVAAAGLFLLRTYRREAQLASLRSDFVSVVTHDLKTPITSIRVLVDTLRMGRARDEEKARQYFGMIAGEAERLERLIDDILAFARIEAGNAAYGSEPVDLGALVGSVVDSFRHGAEAAGFQLDVSLGVSPGVNGDADALRRVAWNLLSNAMKFSGGSKWIGVRVFERGGKAVLEVEDRGIGIDQSETGRIFEKFYRGAETSRRQLPGTGLGLSLVRHVVRAHNGEIEVSSKPKEGATFRILLPAAAPEDGKQGHEEDTCGRG